MADWQVPSSRWVSTSESWGLKTLWVCKQFRCKQCCCSVVLVVLIFKKKQVSYDRLLKAGSLLPGAIRDRKTARVGIGYLFSNLGTDTWRHTGRHPACLPEPLTVRGSLFHSFAVCGKRLPKVVGGGVRNDVGLSQSVFSTCAWVKYVHASSVQQQVIVDFIEHSESCNSRLAYTCTAVTFQPF